MPSPGMVVVFSVAVVMGFAMLSFADEGQSPVRGHGRGDRISSRSLATRSEVIARNGMAATSHPLATQIALDTLRDGGTAVDAAIAANAALGLMEPTGCGIGGDLFAIVWDDRSKRLYGLNASGRSPAGLTAEYFREQGLQKIPPYGPLPVTVPGCVDGWFELHKKFGRLPMQQILTPAIRYAQEGFPVTELIAHYWAIGGRRLKDYPGFADTFLINGKPPRKGDLFRNPALADTLSLIASGGRTIFYHGALASRIDQFCRDNGCFLRKSDLASHTSTWVEPLATNYRGYDVWELPPNGQGIAALQMLNILEGFDLAAMKHNSAAYLHHHLEAKKLVYEDRARFYADPSFTNLPIARLISKTYAEQRRALIDPQRAAAAFPAGRLDLQGADRALFDGDTIYLTVADKQRNMVSLIQSNYRGFGSGLCPTQMGFCLQDRGELFTLQPDHPNAFAPKKRPFHTIIPAFVTRNNKPVMSFGVMGGDMQPQGHVQVLCNLIDFDMNLQEAGDAARYHHTGSSEPTGTTMTDGGKVALESGVAPNVRSALQAMGHHVEDDIGGFGGYQAIRYDAKRDIYIGASESRKDGAAAGY